MKTILNQSDEISRRRFAQGAASTFLGVGMLPATQAVLSGSAFAAVDRDKVWANPGFEHRFANRQEFRRMPDAELEPNRLASRQLP